jgi:hypothetical protein
MIAYVSETRLDLLDRVLNELFIVEIVRIPANHLHKLVVGNGADFSRASVLVVDLSGMKDTSDEIIQAFGAFRKMYPDARVIVVADREPAGSPVFERLINLEIYNMVTTLADSSAICCSSL